MKEKNYDRKIQFWLKEKDLMEFNSLCEKKGVIKSKILRKLLLEWVKNNNKV